IHHHARHALLARKRASELTPKGTLSTSSVAEDQDLPFLGEAQGNVDHEIVARVVVAGHGHAGYAPPLEQRTHARTHQRLAAANGAERLVQISDSVSGALLDQ